MLSKLGIHHTAEAREMCLSHVLLPFEEEAFLALVCSCVHLSVGLLCTHKDMMRERVATRKCVCVLEATWNAP